MLHNQQLITDVYLYLSGMLKSSCSEGTLILGDSIKCKYLDMKELCFILLLKLELQNGDEGKYFASLITLI
jgi:hypothetical protein